MINEEWHVTSAETRENEMIVLTGNLLINNGGNLTLINTSVSFNCLTNGSYYLEVSNGSELNIIDNSLLTS